MSALKPCFPGRFTVGDPIDVVTGANIDSVIDFTVPGPLPLEWRRFYSSAQRTERRALGLGHSHAYDYVLEYSIDGLKLTEPRGQTIPLPGLNEGASAVNMGVRIRRKGANSYEVSPAAHTVLEFVFPANGQRAFLVALRKRPHVISFEYASDGSLSGITDAAGKRIVVRMLAGLVTEIASSERRLIAYFYDASGNLVRATDAYGNSAAFHYDALNRMVARTDRLGYTFHFHYDSESRCVYSHGDDGLYAVKLRYLTAEKATVVTKSDGGEWTYLMDDAGSVIQRIDPHGGTTNYKYDESGHLTEETDPGGNRVLVLADGAGNAVAKRNRFGELLPLDSQDSTNSHAVPANSLEWEYGRLLNVGGDAPTERVLQQMPADLQSLVTVQGRPQGPVRDESGVKFKDVSADGKTRTWSRDAAGNTVRYRDRDGGLFQYQYLSWDLLHKVMDPAGVTTTYEYDAETRIVRVTDPAGNPTAFVYDLPGRVTEVHRHGRLRERYSYDPAGALVRKSDAEGRDLLKFEVAPGNLKTKRTLSSGEVHILEYDERGRMVKCSTGDSVTTLAYDDTDRRTADMRDGLGVEHEFKDGELSAITYFGKFTVRWRRVGNVLVMTDPTGAEHRIHLFAGRIARREIANGTSEHVQYDAEGRCLFKVIRQSRVGAPLWVRQYTYSGEGDLLAIDDSETGRTECGYDPAHRLISVRRTDGAEQQFAYDAAGNLTAQPGLERASISPGNLLTSANGSTFEYDERHRVAVRRTGTRETRYFYDSRDYLVRCESDGSVWQATYDPLGRRTSKTAGERKTSFYWDGDRLAAEIRATGIVRLYVYLDLFAVCPCAVLEYEDIDSAPEHAECFHVFSNQIGAPELIQDKLGETVWQGRTEPYGAVSSDMRRGKGLPFRMPGHYLDEELGLHYNRFRYYDPVLGRYLQPDPLGIAGGLNLYAYPPNPLAHCDVRGECPTDGDEDPPRRQDGNDADAWVPPPRRGQDSTDPPKYAGEHLSESWVRSDQAAGVTIFTPREREAYRVVAGPGGRLVYAQTGQPVDTGATGPGIYVMDTHGNVYVHPEPRRGVIHHSSLGAGEPVAAAGQMEVVQGIPTMIDDGSGHYGGTLPNRSPHATRREMTEQGVDTSGMTVTEEFPP